LVPLKKSASGGLCANDIQTGNPEVEARFATQRGLVLPNAVVLTDATERPTTARHNFVSHEYYVLMTPLASFRQYTAKGRSFSYFHDVD